MPSPEDIEAAIKRLASRRLLIGIPQENDPRTDEDGNASPIGNASIGYIQEMGSPARKIHARPFLVPGVEKALPEITTKLREAATAAAAGDLATIDIKLREAGELGVTSVQNTITAGIPPPLTQATVDARRLRQPGVHYRVRIKRVHEELARRAAGYAPSVYLREAATPADVTPLYDTGTLLKAITYVIRDTK
jgi:hypothetical protein